MAMLPSDVWRHVSDKLRGRRASRFFDGAKGYSSRSCGQRSRESTSKRLLSTLNAPTCSPGKGGISDSP